jgi:antitoxin MazE
MDLHIAKWGNSLAVRIPAEYVRSFGLKAGDTVQANLTADGALTIRADKWNRDVFAKELEKARKATKVGSSVMEEVRSGARY